ncbi:MAG: hypothetical protein ACREFU_07780 [Acetobacteraceae bacterium]
MNPFILKSNNKIRLQKSEIDANKNVEMLGTDIEQANGLADAVYSERVGKADATRGGMPRAGTAIDTGELIVRLIGPRAMNCEELSCVACYYAFEDCKDKSIIWRGSLTPPADHIFCFIGSSANGLSNIVVSDLANSSLDIWAVDPWANVYCVIRKYPQLVAEKMERWTSYGKRIYWNGPDTRTAGWWAPKGKYGDKFLNSKLALSAAG